MTPTELDTAVLECLGWKQNPNYRPNNLVECWAWRAPDGYDRDRPDLTDLQVIHELWEKDADDEYWFALHLAVLGSTISAACGKDCMIAVAKATPEQRMTALLKWKVIL